MDCHGWTVRIRVSAMSRALLLLCLLAFPAWGQTGISKETRRLFEWFDSLGFEDTSKSKFVHIRTGAWKETDGKREYDECGGFLLEDRGATFRVVLADLTIALCEKAGVGETDENFCGYREIPIDKEARKVLRDLEDGKYFEKWEDRAFNYEDRITRPAQVFVLARACAHRGHGALAESLVRALRKHPWRDGSNRSREPLQDELERQFGNMLSWQIRSALRDPLMNWADLSARASKIAEALGDSRMENFAAATARLAEEETAHLRTAPKSLEGLTPDEAARELVWRLRDEQDPDWESDFWQRPWPFVPRKSNGAMEGLRKLSFDAVPALIEELKQERLSRRILRSERYGGFISTSNTNDLAMKVLNDIAGLNFYQIGWGDAPERTWSLLVAAVEKWWSEVKVKGERGWLVENVQTGDSNAEQCAKRLKAKFPESFIDALLTGISKTTDSGLRAGLTRELWDSRDPRVDEFLREELRKGPALGNRVAAAYPLRHRGDTEAEGAIRNEWLALVKKSRSEDAANGRKEPTSLTLPGAAESGGGAPDSAVHALQFLVNGNSPDSMKSLLSAWEDFPKDVRGYLANAFYSRDFALDTVVQRTPDATTRVLIREILLNALEKTMDLRGGVPKMPADSAYAVAIATALNAHWPKEFPFDSEASEQTQHRNRIAMVNVHRRESGASELPSPPENPKVPATKANFVTAIEWLHGPDAPNPAFKKRIDGWKDRKIDPDLIVQLLIDYARKPLPHTKELSVSVCRQGDATGIVVLVSLRSGEPGKNAGRNMSHSVRFKAGGQSVGSSGGSADSCTKLSEWTDFRDRAARAIKAPAEQPFTFSASVSLSE